LQDFLNMFIQISPSLANMLNEWGIICVSGFFKSSKCDDQSKQTNANYLGGPF